MTIDDQHTFIVALGILLSAIMIMMVAECANGGETTDETTSFLTYSPPNGVNCAEKKQGARPACWKSHDWDAYCRETGNCRR